MLERYLGSLPSLDKNEQAVDLGIRPPKGVEKVVYKGKENKATVRLVFTGEYEHSMESNIRLDALAEVLNIKLTERLRELEGGVYAPQARSTYQKLPTGRYAVNVYFGCAAENVEKLINATLEEIKKLQDSGAEAVDVQKSMTEKRRETELQLRDNGFWLQYLSNTMENNDDPGEVLKYIESMQNVTPETIQASATKYLGSDQLIRIVLMPEKSNGCSRGDRGILQNLNLTSKLLWNSIDKSEYRNIKPCIENFS